MSSTDRAQALRNSYDLVAEDYAREIYGELAHKPLDRALLDCFGELVAGRGVVADVGCGPGHVGRYLHDRGLDVLGLDLSPAMVEVARRLNPGMTFQEGNMLDLPVADGAWAGIVAFYSIIHVHPDDLRWVFAEFFRALIAGGLLLVAFHLGTERVHRDEWWGHAIDLDAYFLETETVASELHRAGIAIQARIEREPNEAIEYPSTRGYILARKPDASG